MEYDSSYNFQAFSVKSQEFTLPDVDLSLSFQMSVEVERKFLCNADTLKIIEEIGGESLTCFNPFLHD